MDSIVAIPIGGLTFVIARTSHGKTAYLINICSNMLMQYPAKTFVFLSYEEAAKKISLKFMNIFNNKVISEMNKSRNLKFFENYLKKDEKTATVKKGIDLFDKFTKNGNLLILDKSFSINELENKLYYINKNFPLGVVFIDYIQKIRTQEITYSRQVELQKKSDRILGITKELDISTISAAQLVRDKYSDKIVRLDNIRESGDFEQDGSLILGLENPYVSLVQNNQGQEAVKSSGEQTIVITVLKNREGRIGGKIDFIFNEHTHVIKEK